jgi:hypothetical protein
MQFNEPLPRRTILGPESSSTLLALSKERGDDWVNGHCPESARPQFIVYSATVEDAILIPEKFRSSCDSSSPCLSDYFDRHKQVDLYRMTATDAALAKTMRDELIRRGVANGPATDRSSHVVLVSEWDTFYGQSLPSSISGCLAAKERGDCAEIGRHFLHSYSYLRGLDGQMPNVDGFSSEKAATATDSKQDINNQDKEKESNKLWSYAKPNDRAEGQNQFDYLRRLGDEIQELDTRLRREEGNHIKAVGILGSDRYDKLLLLQALRPLLPDAVFFTTDLDALSLSPTALPYTHNLLIASSFGLRLQPDIQCSVPPFRSSYQTGAFLASRSAIRWVDGPPQPWLAPPLLFEVGNSRLFQFPNDHDRTPLSSDSADQTKCENGPLVFAYIHPAAPSMFPKADIPTAFALAIALSGLVVGAALSCGPGRRLIWRGVDAFQPVPKRDSLRGAGIFILFCTVAAVAFGLVYAAWPPLADLLTREGQPMIWLEGIGVWPTTALRIAILILCALLFFHGHIALDSNMKIIKKELLIADKWADAAKKRESGERSWIKDAGHSFYMPARDIEADRNDDLFWRKYIFQGYLGSRLVRVGAGVVIMLMLWLILYSIFGNSPGPARGRSAIGSIGQ